MSKPGPRCGEKMEPLHKPGTPSSMDEPIAGVAPKEINCPECGKAFHTKLQLQRHRQTAHEHEF